MRWGVSNHLFESDCLTVFHTSVTFGTRSLLGNVHHLRETGTMPKDKWHRLILFNRFLYRVNNSRFLFEAGSVVGGYEARGRGKWSGEWWRQI